MASSVVLGTRLAAVQLKLSLEVVGLYQWKLLPRQLGQYCIDDNVYQRWNEVQDLGCLGRGFPELEKYPHLI